MSYFGLTLLGTPSPIKPLLKGADELGGLDKVTPDVLLVEADRAGISSGIIKTRTLLVFLASFSFPSSWCFEMTTITMIVMRGRNFILAVSPQTIQAITDSLREGRLSTENGIAALESSVYFTTKIKLEHSNRCKGQLSDLLDDAKLQLASEKNRDEIEFSSGLSAHVDSENVRILYGQGRALLPQLHRVRSSGTIYAVTRAQSSAQKTIIDLQ